MRTLDEIQKAQRTYRRNVTTLLGMGGIPEHIPKTEREWVLFNTNQKLRDLGIGKPIPWPDTPPVPWTAEDVLGAIERAAQQAATA